MRYFVSIVVVLAIAVLQILYGGAYYTIFRIPTYVLLACALLAGLPTSLLTKRNFSYSCVVATTILFLYMIERTTGHDARLWPFFGLFTAAFSVYLLFVTVINQSRYRLIFIIGLLVFAFLQVLVGLQQYARDEHYTLIPWLSGQLRIWAGDHYPGRGHGTYLNPNQYAAMLGSLGTYALAFVFWGRFKAGAKLLLLFSSLACFTGVVISLSRGGMLATGCSLFVFIIISVIISLRIVKSRQVLIIASLLGFIALIGITAYISFHSSVRLQSRFENIVTGDSRLEIWDAALRQFESSPFIGRGPGSYGFLSRIYINRWRSTLGSDPGYAHNEYLQILAEYGLIGFALFILVLGIHFFNGCNEIGQQIRISISSGEMPKRNTLAVLIASLCACVGWIVHMLFDSIQHVPANMLLAAATLGMLAGNEFWKPRAEDDHRFAFLAWLPNRIVGAGTAVCAVVLILFCLRVGKPELHALLAENAIIKKDIPVALNETDLTLQLETRNAYYHYLSGEAFLLAGDQNDPEKIRRDHYESAQKALQTATEITPEEYLYWLRLGTAYDMTHQFPEAAYSYLMAIERNPGVGAVYEEYARHYGREGALTQAYRYADIGALQPGGIYGSLLRQEFKERIQKLKTKN
ncbi:MAG: O-antigen ligase family protein [Chthoniobacterales bacterium]